MLFVESVPEDPLPNERIHMEIDDVTLVKELRGLD
jgi:hypothetical protein